MVLVVLAGLEELACGADSLADVAARCCPDVRNAGTSLQMTKRAHAFSVAPSGPRGRRSMGQGRLSEAWGNCVNCQHAPENRSPFVTSDL